MIAAASAACGGSDGAKKGASSADFATSYTRATEAYQSRVASLKNEAQSATGKGVSAQLPVYESMRAAVRDAKKNYDGLKAPKDLQAKVDHIVSVLGHEDEALGRVISAAQAGNTADVQAALTQLAELLRDYAATNQAIQQRLQANGGKR